MKVSNVCQIGLSNFTIRFLEKENSMGEKSHLAYFDGPHGRIENLAIETCGKERNQLLLFPYWYTSQNDLQKGLHHHLFQDDRRADKMALAYTTHLDITGNQVREYWVYDTNGWQLTDEYDFHQFIERMTFITIGWAFRKIETENRSKKEQLCSQAESLSWSTNWKETTQTFKKLHEQWKQIGSAGRDDEDSLWQRFRAAQDKLNERRAAFYEQRDREQIENLNRKESLCKTAESLVYDSDYKAATQRVKELQATWKTIGHVPRDRADEIWHRFRNACDCVFTQAKEQRERKQTEWRSKMQDTLKRKRDQVVRLRASVEHDEGNISRWQDTINKLRPGGRADVIRADLESKISDVGVKIRSKRDRLYELETSIRDIESKL
jgi:hypothetical protein